MTAGTFAGKVSITAPAATGIPASIPVPLPVAAAAAPTLSVSPSLLSFSYQQGGAAPAAQSLSVASGGGYNAAKSTSSPAGTRLSGTTPRAANLAASNVSVDGPSSTDARTTDDW